MATVRTLPLGQASHYTSYTSRKPPCCWQQLQQRALPRPVRCVDPLTCNACRLPACGHPRRRRRTAAALPCPWGCISWHRQVGQELLALLYEWQQLLQYVRGLLQYKAVLLQVARGGARLRLLQVVEGGVGGGTRGKACQQALTSSGV